MSNSVSFNNAVPSGYRVDKEEDGTVKLKSTIAGLNVKDILDEYDKAIEVKLQSSKDKLEKIQKKHEAISEIQLKVEANKTALAELRGVRVIESESGIFSYSIPSIKGYDGLSGSNFMSVTAAPGTDRTTFTFRITQLASKDSIAGAGTEASSSAALGWAGNLTFPHKDGVSPAIVVAVTAGMSLSDVKNAINTQKDSTGVIAEVVPSGANFQLQFLSTQSAKPLTYSSTVAGGNSATTLPTSSVKTISNLSAQVEYNGTSSEHTTNQVTISGKTFNLLEVTDANPAKKLTVTLDPDPITTHDMIQNWVTSHNDLIDTIHKHAALDFDTYRYEGDSFELPILANNNTITSLELFLTRNDLTRSIAGISTSDYSNLMDIGLKSEGGKLTLDSTTLLNALQTDYTQVMKVFDFSSKSSNTYFGVSKHPTSVSDTLANATITVTFSKSAGGVLSAQMSHSGNPAIYTLAEADINQLSGGDFTFLKGPAGTPFDGMEFYYSKALANGESQTTSITMAQGIADRFFSYSKSILTLNTGSFDREHELLTTQEKRQNEFITKIEASEKRRRDMLEIQLDKANEIMAQLYSILARIQIMEGAMTAGQ